MRFLGADVEIDVVSVFDLAKDSSTFAQGAKVYWDNTNAVAASTASGNGLIGVATAAAAAGDATARVRLNGIGI